MGTGVFFSLRTRFVQVRCFGEGMRRVFGGFSMRGGRQKGGLSSFQALTTAIAAQVGTGNIIGSCSAILVGGPVPSSGCGSSLFSGCPPFTPRPFWPRRPGVVHADGIVSGGPVYYIKRAFQNKFGTFLAGFFAVAITLALGFIGCMVQSNSIVRPAATPSAFPLGS